MEKTSFYSLVLTLIAFTREIVAPPVRTTEHALEFLRRYGYMNAAGDPSLVSMTNTKDPILRFQKFMGLDETGELDNPTLEMMNSPRCGMRDEYENTGFGRKKRYATEGVKWMSNNITYRISKYPKRIKDRRKVDREIARAFRVWQYETPLMFWPTETGDVNINIRFEERFHGDGQSFDGPGFTLAHATTPRTRGYVHFDDEEEWTIDEYSGTNLFQVAAHEFGHSLGLLHSHVKGALMFPSYNEGVGPSATFHEDDINGVHEMYGPWLLNMCADRSIDAATMTDDGKKYAFKGKYYWEMNFRSVFIILGSRWDNSHSPRVISDDWGGHPGEIDAALTWTNGQTFFFKGDKYWSFRNKTMDPGYPKLISEKFEGIPMNIDAAFVWNEKTYFFKGSNYWVYDSRTTPHISSAYPQPISNMEGIPDYIDAGLQFRNETFLIKGNRYYLLQDTAFSVAQGFPYSITESIPFTRHRIERLACNWPYADVKNTTPSTT